MHKYSLVVLVLAILFLAAGAFASGECSDLAAGSPCINQTQLSVYQTDHYGCGGGKITRTDPGTCYKEPSSGYLNCVHSYFCNGTPVVGNPLGDPYQCDEPSPVGGASILTKGSSNVSVAGNMKWTYQTRDKYALLPGLKNCYWTCNAGYIQNGNTCCLTNACGNCAVEVCNGIDDDCDGSIDEGVLNACGACGAVPTEVCNGLDDDCDGSIDEGGVCDVCYDGTASTIINHLGNDWNINSSQELVGKHINVKTFKIAAGVKVTVKPFNGTICGLLDINAQTIIIDGNLDASGAGYGGGGGGGATPGIEDRGSSGYYNNTYLIFGQSGAGIAGGTNGGTAAKGAVVGTVYTKAYTGIGGNGGGTAGGVGGTAVLADANTSTCAWGINGISGQLGGYAAAGLNGDSSIDKNILLGSGGGGGSGGVGACREPSQPANGGGGGGAAGARGGGAIKLFSSQNTTITGAILVNGSTVAGNGKDGNYNGFTIGHNFGTNYNREATYGGGSGSNCNKYVPDLCGGGGSGGDATLIGDLTGGLGGYIGTNGGDWNGKTFVSDDGSGNTYTNEAKSGGNGGNGGVGAGGGLLIDANKLTITGIINNLGGGNNLTNGGTVKIFSCGTPTITGTISSGRTFSKDSCGLPAECSAPQSSPCTAAGIAARNCYLCDNNEYFDVNNMRYCFNNNTAINNGNSGVSKAIRLIDPQNTYCLGRSFLGYVSKGLADFGLLTSTAERLQNILAVKASYAPMRAPLNSGLKPGGLKILTSCNPIRNAFPEGTYPYLYSDQGKLGVINCSFDGMVFSAGSDIDENGRLNDGWGDVYGAACMFERTQKASCNYCTGELDLSGRAVLCSGGDANLSSITPRTLVNSCTGLAKCEYYCPAGYVKDGNNCVVGASSLACTGTISDPHAEAYLGDENNLLPTDLLTRILVDVNTLRKCEWHCSAGYNLIGGVCTLIPVFSCTGNVDGNSTICNNDSNGLTVNTTKTLVDSCTDATKCEYYCPTGYVKDNNTCVYVPPTVYQCQGGAPLNALICSADEETGLASNVDRAVVGNDISACSTRKCEYYCLPDYNAVGNTCVLKGTLIIPIDHPTKELDYNSIYSLSASVTADGNIAAIIVCTRNGLKADFNLTGPTGQVWTLGSPAADCNITPIMYTLKPTVPLEDGSQYTLVASIHSPCKICTKEAFFSYNEPENPAPIPDNEPLLVVLVLVVVVVIIASKSSKKA